MFACLDKGNVSPTRDIRLTSNEKYVTIVKMVAHIMRKSAILNLRVNPDVKVDIIVEKDEAK